MTWRESRTLFLQRHYQDFRADVLSGLSGAFNYSFTEVSGRASNGTDAILPGVSRPTANLIGYYVASSSPQVVR